MAPLHRLWPLLPGPGWDTGHARTARNAAASPGLKFPWKSHDFIRRLRPHTTRVYYFEGERMLNRSNEVDAKTQKADAMWVLLERRIPGKHFPEKKVRLE